MNFSTRLKGLRERKGLRQEDLAIILNISRQAISNYEQGTRFPKDEQLLVSIADFFEVSTDYLLGRDYSSSNLKKVVKDFDTEYNYCKNKLIKKLTSKAERLPDEIIKGLISLVEVLPDE
ncbi:helix-turn-helix transcriptional regulator [Alkaliphilus pronyensis]|uniref:Helix-turn-helix transcriptional regulator n=1 Tax=Alkaliphilus pronyensis TaxID=1482732 RepID=A0A6I0FKP4_9FIRM|nr:helix-turn-helix transcriptional regulator [Alkaliphilus pronyensis]KAB3539657.1 helix-turn-helix transcriptional regulator [Alkaliphilus pronyensis]